MYDLFLFKKAYPSINNLLYDDYIICDRCKSLMKNGGKYLDVEMDYYTHYCMKCDNTTIIPISRMTSEFIKEIKDSINIPDLPIDKLVQWIDDMIEYNWDIEEIYHKKRDYLSIE